LQAWRIWSAAWFIKTEERGKIKMASRFYNRTLVLKVWRTLKNFKSIRKLKQLRKSRRILFIQHKNKGTLIIISNISSFMFYMSVNRKGKIQGERATSFNVCIMQLLMEMETIMIAKIDGTFLSELISAVFPRWNRSIILYLLGRLCV